jgi:superfamily I DNA/RNA helicase
LGRNALDARWKNYMIILNLIYILYYHHLHADNSSRLGKRLWVKKNMPGTKLILASRKNKQDYAKENAILIDDLKPNH